MSRSSQGDLFPLHDLEGLAEALSAHVGMLAAQIGERHFAHKAALEDTADYIAKQFREAGYDAQFENFQVKRLPLLTTLRTEVQNQTKIKNTDFKNVVATKKGKEPQCIVVGAHYDTVMGSPGADDNASGVAVLLEVARFLKDTPLQKSVLFAAFTNEEPPFFRTAAMGSAQFLKARPETEIVAMFSLEMLGYYSEAPHSQTYPPFLKYFYPNQGNFVALIGNMASRKLVKRVAESFRVECRVPLACLAAPRFVPGVDFSDQLNFWKAGIPAVMITDTAFNRNPNYHSAADLPQTLDYRKMAEVGKGLIASVIRLAGLLEPHASHA